MEPILKTGFGLPSRRLVRLLSLKIRRFPQESSKNQKNNTFKRPIKKFFSLIITGFLIISTLSLVNKEATATDIHSKSTYTETLKTLNVLLKLYDNENSDLRSIENSLFEFMNTLPRQQLIRLLNHKNNKICSLSAHLLAEKWQAVDSLIMIINTDKDDACQWAAIEALYNAKLGDAKTVKPLIARLVDNEGSSRILVEIGALCNIKIALQ